MAFSTSGSFRRSPRPGIPAGPPPGNPAAPETSTLIPYGLNCMNAPKNDAGVVILKGNSVVASDMQKNLMNIQISCSYDTSLLHFPK